MIVIESSGDAFADRRYALAMQLSERGDHDAALDLLGQAAELAPHWPPICFARGEILMSLERADEAADEFKRYLSLDADDRLGATIHLTRLGVMPVPDALPESYVETLFDNYAPEFDAALVERLGYRVPQILFDTVQRLKPVDAKTERVLDLGCGTGLAGEAFAPRAAVLDGVDLSAGMIEQARKRKLYDTLAQGELLAHLRGLDAKPYDVVLAADVLIYLGALEDVFAAAARVLKPGGLFVFSLQKGDAAADYMLGADCRFSHARGYVAKTATDVGLAVVSVEEAVIRQDAGADVTGLICAFARPAEDGDRPGDLPDALERDRISV